MWTIGSSVPLLLLCLSFLLCHASSTKHVARRKRNIFWKCSSDLDCTATGSSCVEGFCACAAGYVYNDAMTSCLKIATSIGEQCEETIQCSTYLLSGGTCEENICTCGHGYHYLHGRCYKSIGFLEQCRNDDNCYVNADIEATSCKEGTCQCSDGFYQREYRTCRRAGKAVGEECTVNVDCVFKNGYCTSDFVCAEHANKTESTYELSYEHDLLENYAASVDQTEQRCKTNEECTVIGNSICGPSGICICDRAHFVPPKKNMCVPELGEPCQMADKPAIKRSTCRNGKWSCNKGTVGSKDNRQCRKTVKKYGWSCLHDEQCYIFGPDSACVDKKCVCTGHSRFIDEELFCWTAKGIDESCVSDVDCYMEQLNGTLVCTNNVCSCPEGSHINLNGTLCIESSAELGSDCERDTDCATENSVCTKGVCTCGLYYYNEEGKCYPGIGAICSDADECTPKNSRCYGRICRCNHGFAAVSTKSCLPSLEYGDPCEADAQCASKTPNSRCERIVLDDEFVASRKSADNVVNVCTCKDGYHHRFDTCFRRKELGQLCDSVGECYLDFDQDRVSCMNGICQCAFGYMRYGNQCSGASVSIISSWLLAVSAVITKLSLP